ncbi:protein kinase [Kitasatospora sp. NPDC051984]|uniref:serine/threonine-protein kinase n=1 Tax=Kitasatospora sp. NPDC051984 TaxID=3364059 RepID=UPI0037C8F8EE
MWGPGTVLGGRYTLGERLGSGGMGEVWRAEDGVLGRAVAIKVMHPGLGDEQDFIERFRREARILATVRHPGIVQVIDYCEPAETTDVRATYIVMELIEGRPLHLVLAQDGPMVPARALGLVAEALDALHAAHARDIVHRDLKPSNLMVRDDGGVVVTDFGIARALAGTRLTTTHSVLGTALYAAPEQAGGQAVTPRSDLYSIGVVCFELLTGQPPFTGETVLEVVVKHLQQPPPGLAEAFPAPVRAFVARALAKDPADRFPDAAAMAAAARSAAELPASAKAVAADTLLATVPDSPTPSTVPAAPPADTGARTAETPPPESRRRRLLLPIVVPVVISLGTGGVFLVQAAPWKSDTSQTGSGPVSAPGGGSPLPVASTSGGPPGSASPSASAPAPASDSPSPGPQQPSSDQPGTTDTRPAQGGGGTGGGGTGGGGSSNGGGGNGGGGNGGGGNGGGNQQPGGTTAPPNTPPANGGTTPGPPAGCGGAGWGYLTSVGSGQRLGLAANTLAGGTAAVMDRNTSFGWYRSGPDPGGWYTLYPCNMSKPILVQNATGTAVTLRSGFNVLTSWSVVQAPTPGAYYLKDYMASLCLTDNGSGNAATMENCTPGNTTQQWRIPPAG